MSLGTPQTSYYDRLPTGGENNKQKLNYQAFVDAFVDSNGDRATAIRAAGYAGDDFAGNARALMSKPEVKRAIAERAANQFFSQLPLGLRALEEVLGAKSTYTYTQKTKDADGKVVEKEVEVPDLKMMKLKVQVALKMFELAQVKELATATLAMQASKKKIDLNELAEKLAQLSVAGVIDIPLEEAGNSESYGVGAPFGADDFGGEVAADDESSELRTVSQAEASA